MNAKPSKYFILERIEKMVEANPSLKILDLGSGRSLNFLSLLVKYPDITYVGIEPNPSEAKLAKEAVRNFSQAKIINSTAYSQFSDMDETFDVVVSLSVLEHVKTLSAFLAFSVKKLKPGGTLIHLYDLAHSLHPSSFKERIQTKMCANSFWSRFIPELKFAAYVSCDKVKEILAQNNVQVTEVTYHNMLAHISLLKSIGDKQLGQQILSDAAFLEVRAAELIDNIKVREKLFPSVCVWGTKK